LAISFSDPSLLKMTKIQKGLYRRPVHRSKSARGRQRCRRRRGRWKRREKTNLKEATTALSEIRNVKESEVKQKLKLGTKPDFAGGS
jgi:hypothetical protein